MGSLSVASGRHFRERVLYTASVIAGIRARLDKFGECLVDAQDVIAIWDKQPWLEWPGATMFHEKLETLCEELGCTVEWIGKGELKFITKREPPIIIAG